MLEYVFKATEKEKEETAKEKKRKGGKKRRTYSYSKEQKPGIKGS